MKPSFPILLAITTLLLSCMDGYKNSVMEQSQLSKPNGQQQDSNKQVFHNSENARAANDSFLANDATFVNEQLLKGRFKVELAQYDTFKRVHCFPEKLDRQTAIEAFEGLQNVGDLDKDSKDDYVFVLPPINRCEEGQAYYFSNPAIPRINTDSYCCHPQSIFSIGDIDEDGSNELAEYYSSCASRYKAITIWTLKSNAWQKVKTFSYVLNDEYKVFEDFDKLYRKAAKNKVRFLEITDVTVNGEVVKKWHTITIK